MDASPVDIDLFDDTPPVERPPQHQYNCCECGELRFVDVDPAGYKFMQESCGMQFRISCPTCCEKREAFENERKAVTGRTTSTDGYLNRWIPPDYQSLTAARLPDPKRWEEFKNWRADKRGLLFYGGPRRGKSRIAYGIAARHIRANVRVECYDCRTFRAAVESRIEERTLWRWMEDLQVLPLLLLDDLGKFKGAGKRIEEELFNVIKIRFEYLKPVLVTTNLDPFQLSQTFSDSIAGPLVSRLTEMCDTAGFDPVQETGLTPDLFGQKGVEKDDL